MFHECLDDDGDSEAPITLTIDEMRELEDLAMRHLVMEATAMGLEECADHVGGGVTGSGGQRRSRLARVWRAARKAAEAKADWECGRPLGGPWRRRQDAFINRPQREPQRRGREGTR